MSTEDTMLPSLSSLSINEDNKGSACDVGASWTWDQGNYQVRFSVDIGVIEQLSGLGKIDANDNFVSATLPYRSHQLPPIALLRVAIEYTIQRIWDMECLVPWIDLTESFPSNPDPSSDIPFPDSASSIIDIVAKMAVAVNDTETPEQARKSYAQRQAEQANQRKRPRSKNQTQIDDIEPDDEEETIDVEDEDDDEDKEYDDEDEDSFADRLSRGDITPVDREVIKIKQRIKNLQNQYRGRRRELRSLLVKLEYKYADILDKVQRNEEELPGDGQWKQGIELEEQDELDLAEWLVRNKPLITKIPMYQVRNVPPNTYYGQGTTRTRKYVQWCKIELNLYDNKQVGARGVRQDYLYDVPVKHTMNVPTSLDGSFFSGRIRDDFKGVELLALIEMEHVVPRSHFKNCRLVREFGDPDHLAMITVFSEKGENASKGDKYLPLAREDPVYKRMMATSNSVFTIDSSEFGLARRMMAARAVCAAYLTLFMIERKPDANTELGSRYGGVYWTYFTEIIDLMKSVDLLSLTPEDLYNQLSSVRTRKRKNEIFEDRKEVRQKWAWEVGLAFLQWHWLVGQPYNPLPYMAYQRASGAFVDDTMTPFFEDMLARRFSNNDMMSEMLRREMMQEVANAPLKNTGLDLDDSAKLRQAVQNLQEVI